MTKITIDDKEYDTDNLNEAQKDIINVLNTGKNSIALLNHMIQCAQAIQNMKTTELKDTLEKLKIKDKK
tara:strand:+ start:2076 stop:2282 length:207 start_codon:yes stop_codon:yes gene_type:complete